MKTVFKTIDDDFLEEPFAMPRGIPGSNFGIYSKKDSQEKFFEKSLKDSFKYHYKNA